MFLFLNNFLDKNKFVKGLEKMNICILLCFLLVSQACSKALFQMNSMTPSEVSSNIDDLNLSKEELQRLILNTILEENSKSDDDSYESDRLNRDLRMLLKKKRNDKMNQLKKLTVFNG